MLGCFVDAGPMLLSESCAQAVTSLAELALDAG
jgi:hypothetical protein